MTTPE